MSLTVSYHEAHQALVSYLNPLLSVQPKEHSHDFAYRLLRLLGTQNTMAFDPDYAHIWIFDQLLREMNTTTAYLAWVLDCLFEARRVLLRRDRAQNIVSACALYYIRVNGKFVYSEYPHYSCLPLPVGRDD